MKKTFSIFFLILVSTGLFGQQKKITRQDLQGASAIFDLQMSQNELDTLLSDVQDSLSVIQSLHTQKLPNHVPLSMWQNPVVPGSKTLSPQRKMVWSSYPSISLPKKKSDLAF